MENRFAGMAERFFYMEKRKPMDTMQIGDIEVQYMERKMYVVPIDHERTTEDWFVIAKTIIHAR